MGEVISCSILKHLKLMNEGHVTCKIYFFSLKKKENKKGFEERKKKNVVTLCVKFFLDLFELGFH